MDSKRLVRELGNDPQTIMDECEAAIKRIKCVGALLMLHQRAAFMVVSADESSHSIEVKCFGEPEATSELERVLHLVLTRRQNEKEEKSNGNT